MTVSNVYNGCSLPFGIPKGGTTNQVLTKNSNADYDVKWAAGGGGGSVAWGAITGTLSDQTDLQTALDGKASNKHAIPFGAITASNNTYYLTTYAPYAGTITSIQNVQTSSGTITVAININGTPVTGLSAVAVTSSSQDVNATAANTFALGDEITLVLSSNSSAANLRGTLLITQ